jgi:chromosome segregation ATPase
VSEIGDQVGWHKDRIDGLEPRVDDLERRYGSGLALKADEIESSISRLRAHLNSLERHIDRLEQRYDVDLTPRTMRLEDEIASLISTRELTQNLVETISIQNALARDTRRRQDEYIARVEHILDELGGRISRLAPELTVSEQPDERSRRQAISEITDREGTPPSRP